MKEEIVEEVVEVQPAEKPFLKRRAQLALVFVGMWLFLLLWTMSAFWQHIDELGATYQNAAKLGALAGEFALLALILWHCFDKHLGVRRWSLIFGFFLAGILLAHGGAIRGLHEAATAQHDTEKRMASTLTEMSTKQAGAITGSSTGTQRERLANNRAAVAQQAEIAKSAQSQVASNIASGNDKIKDSSIFPRWYLDGWMYSIIFIAALLFISIVALLMMRDDVDADFDGIVDSQQTTVRRRVVGDGITQQRPKGSPVMSPQPAAKQGSTTITGGGSNFTSLP